MKEREEDKKTSRTEGEGLKEIFVLPKTEWTVVVFRQPREHARSEGSLSVERIGGVNTPSLKYSDRGNLIERYEMKHDQKTHCNQNG